MNQCHISSVRRFKNYLIFSLFNKNIFTILYVDCDLYCLLAFLSIGLFDLFGHCFRCLVLRTAAG